MDISLPAVCLQSTTFYPKKFNVSTDAILAELHTSQQDITVSQQRQLIATRSVKINHVSTQKSPHYLTLL